MVDWNAIAAFGALGLGAYNFAHGLREPARADQREMRKELLQMLYDVEGPVASALELLELADTFQPENVPAVFRSRHGPSTEMKGVVDQLPRIRDRLKLPGYSHVERIRRDLDEMYSLWLMADIYINSHENPRPDAAAPLPRAQVDTAIADARVAMKTALATTRKYIGVVNKIDQGFFIERLKYRS